MGFFDIMKEPPVPFGEPFPLFTRISIETHGFCNRRCPFCPQSIEEQRRKPGMMLPEVFDKVCAYLWDVTYDGVIQAFLLDEPLLNPRYGWYIAKMREAAPLASIYVTTNGDPLGKDVEVAAGKLVQLYEAGVTTFNLNVYDGGEKGEQRKAFYDELVQLLRAEYRVRWTDNKYRRHPTTKRHITVTDMRPDAVRNNPSLVDQFCDRIKNPNVKQVDAYCARPHRHLVVRRDGVVPLCCAINPMDPNVTIAGDLRTQSVDEVWNSKLMFRYRYRLQQRDRSLPPCRTCNHRMAYPHVVRKVLSPDGKEPSST